MRPLTLHFLILLAMLFTISCSSDDMDDLLLIQFTNESEFVIEAFEVSGTDVGTISPFETSDYIQFESVTSMYKIATESLSAVVNGETLHTEPLFWCGTPPLPEPTIFEHGKYQFVIEVVDYGDEKYLRLSHD